jgi:hypothetical protein
MYKEAFEMRCEAGNTSANPQASVVMQNRYLSHTIACIALNNYFPVNSGKASPEYTLFNSNVRIIPFTTEKNNISTLKADTLPTHCLVILLTYSI